MGYSFQGIIQSKRHCSIRIFTGYEISAKAYNKEASAPNNFSLLTKGSRKVNSASLAGECVGNPEPVSGS
jgi:hypothetical protein